MKQQEIYPKVYLYKRIVAARLFMEDHFGEKIDLDNIADEAFFSKYHFIRLFKSVYKETPHQYLVNIRIGKAKHLLASDMTAMQVCYAVGFDSVGSFTSLFKRVVGFTPAAYSLFLAQRKIHIASAPLNFIPGCFAAKNGWFGKHSNFQEAI